MNIKAYKIKTYYFYLIVIGAILFTMPSCAPKSGCPATVSLQAQNKKAESGKKSKKKNKSGLFPNDVKKSAKIRN